MSLSTDVIIIGGGVIGLSTAFRLSCSKLRVTLIEKNRCGSGSTGAALGALWPPSILNQGKHNLLHRKSLDLFSSFSSEIESVSGTSIEYKRSGSLELISSENGVVSARKKVSEDHLIHNSSPILEYLSPEEALSIEGNINMERYGALRCKTSAHLSVESLVSTLKDSCKKLGVNILEDTKVNDLIINNNRATAVLINEDKISAGAILIAAGAWSSEISPIAAPFASVSPVKGQALLVETQSELITQIIRKGSIYLIPKGKNHIAIGSTTEKNSGFNTETSIDVIQGLFNEAINLVPALKRSKILKSWAGVRPSSIDGRPIIGPVPSIDSLFIATGHYKIGIGYAPLTSIIIRDLIINGNTSYDITDLLPRTVKVAA